MSEAVLQIAEEYRRSLFTNLAWLHRLFDGDQTAHEQLVLAAVVLGVSARSLVLG